MIRGFPAGPFDLQEGRREIRQEEGFVVGFLDEVLVRG